MVDDGHYERLRDDLQKEYSLLSGQKTMAWMLFICSGLLFVSNFFGVDERPNRTLGAITLIGVIGGGFWLYKLRNELGRNLRRSIENNRHLDESRRKRP
jgi:hypothetical protein